MRKDFQISETTAPPGGADVPSWDGKCLSAYTRLQSNWTFLSLMFESVSFGARHCKVPLLPDLLLVNSADNMLADYPTLRSSRLSRCLENTKYLCVCPLCCHADQLQYICVLGEKICLVVGVCQLLILAPAARPL